MSIAPVVGPDASSTRRLSLPLMAETEDVFRGWARGRHKLAEYPLDYWFQAPDGKA